LCFHDVTTLAQLSTSWPSPLRSYIVLYPPSLPPVMSCLYPPISRSPKYASLFEPLPATFICPSAALSMFMPLRGEDLRVEPPSGPL